MSQFWIHLSSKAPGKIYLASRTVRKWTMCNIYISKSFQIYFYSVFNVNYTLNFEGSN